MANLQNLVITDRQPTPNNYTMTPDGEVGGVGYVAAADASGITISKKRLALSRRASGERVRFVEKWQFPLMVSQTINGVTVPTVAKIAYVDVTFNFSNLHTEQERKDVVGMVHSAHAPGKALIEDTIVKDTAVY